MARECVDCKSIFDLIPGSGRPRIRCFGCSPAQRKEGPRASHRPPRWRSPRSATCVRCGASFTAKLPHERFCSRRCQVATRNRAVQISRQAPVRTCLFCGSSFRPVETGRRAWCSSECARRASNVRNSGDGHRRRARLYGCRVERVDRLKVFERDGWHCRICGEATPRALMGTSEALAPELDHVVPLSLGGDHAYTNTQCACHACNQAKGGKNRLRISNLRA